MKFEHIGRRVATLNFYPAHRHVRWELIYNTKGAGAMNIDGAEYNFAKGSIFLIPPGTLHEKTSEGGFEDYYFQFSGADFVPRVYKLEDDCDKKLFHLMEILYCTYHENRALSVCESLFDALMGLLKPELGGARMDKYVQVLQHILIREFSNPDFKLIDASREIPVNTDHLRRQFKKELGLTPHGYLTQLRMENAKHLLRDGVSVAEAAYQSGFYDPLYFSRAFHKYAGMPPVQWK